jgi:hypothetical protein
MAMAADCLEMTLMASDGCTVLATRAKMRNGAMMLLENDMFKNGDGGLHRSGWLRHQLSNADDPRRRINLDNIGH